MDKIAYILGAGASANVLPLIKDSQNKRGLPTMLKYFIEQHGDFFSEHGGSSRPSKEELLSISDLVVKFKTPDLLAKFFLEKGDLRRYSILKKLLSKFFIDQEDNDNNTGVTITKENIDPRVIPFLATISSNQKLPDHVKIISWNYDRQLEKAAMKLRPENNKDLYIKNFKVWPNNSKENTNANQYFLMHLNGVAGLLYSPATFVEQEQEQKIFKERESLISFAWEEDESFCMPTFTKNRINIAQQMLNETTILVVIGYSFPFFNRNIDSLLFKSMSQSLKKVYFQDPQLDGSFLYNQFGLQKEEEVEPVLKRIKRKVEIVHIRNVDNYYVPYEL